MCALVRGMTDILTPVNLLPNSDFSRDSGYPSILTWSNPTTGVLYPISTNITVIFYVGTFTNVTLTRSKNSIRITGNYASLSQSQPYIRLNFKMGLHTNTFYTMASKVVDNIGNISHVGIYVQNDGIIAYNSSNVIDNVYEQVMIETTTVEGNQNVRLASVTLPLTESSNFDFTISDCRLYQGKFCDPSIIDSLDVQPANQFALTSDTELWYNDTDCAGFRMNFNQSITANGVRLGACSQVPVGQSGSYFNNMNVYSNMRRCNVADNGKVNAYYGDSSYKEDGSNGQVMVEIPRFYYRVIPIKTKKSNTGWGGTDIVEAEYWVSDSYKEGFKLHPIFMINGEITNRAYIGAFEASTYDVSASSYNTTDAQTVDWTNDKLASIAGAKPTSGLSQTGATRAGYRKIASNRGTGWHVFDIFDLSAVQLLMAVEYASFNSQGYIGRGVVDFTDSNAYSNTAITGSTVGNTSGNATSSQVYINGSVTTQTVNGKKSVSYRGIENMWGNIWTTLDGINYDGPSDVTYIAKPDGTTTYMDDTHNNYNRLGFEFPLTGGQQYVRYFGYDPNNDFVFLPAQCNTSSEPASANGPVTDVFIYNKTSWTICVVGGCWMWTDRAGLFLHDVADPSNQHNRYLGSRLSYKKS